MFVHFASLVVCVNFDGDGWGATGIGDGGGGGGVRDGLTSAVVIMSSVCCV